MLDTKDVLRGKSKAENGEILVKVVRNALKR
jgi:hypothetical protein